MYKRFILLILAGISLLAGCGGGGGGSSSDATQDPLKTSVRAHLGDAYLWYSEIVDVSPVNYATAPDYFNALLVRSKDRFSFSMPRTDAVSLFEEGVETGFGVKWGWAAPGRLYAYYVDPHSPAAASITRGMELTSINGQKIANLSDSYLASALFPEQAGSSVNLTLRSPGTNTTQTKGFSSATFSSTTVSEPLILSLPGGGRAGYLLFNEHLLTSEQGLNQAMTFFKQQGVSELVLDMRYNPGGYLMIAEELASMVGGVPVQGKVFERLLFNSKHPEKSQNPDYVFRFSAVNSKGASLPLLGLSRVFVLAGPNTCSASEAIVNGLMPFVQVVLIGQTTCGKPYGFIQTDLGDQAYFAIQFEGVNANGTDNYKTGFAPTCNVGDDLSHPLGDIREERLKTALYYVSNNGCPATSTVILPKTAPSDAIPGVRDGQLIGQKPSLKLLR